MGLQINPRKSKHENGILELLKTGDMSAPDIGRAMDVKRNTIDWVLQSMKKRGLVHIVALKQGKGFGGNWINLWRVGDGPSVQLPYEDYPNAFWPPRYGTDKILAAMRSVAHDPFAHMVAHLCSTH